MRVSDSNSGLKMSKRCQRNPRSKCYSTRNDHKLQHKRRDGAGIQPTMVMWGSGGECRWGEAGEAFQELSCAQHRLRKLPGELRDAAVEPSPLQGWNQVWKYGNVKPWLLFALTAGG